MQYYDPLYAKKKISGRVLAMCYIICMASSTYNLYVLVSVGVTWSFVGAPTLGFECGSTKKRVAFCVTFWQFLSHFFLSLYLIIMVK